MKGLQPSGEFDYMAFNATVNAAIQQYPNFANDRDLKIVRD
jgi:hypothetical protein